MSKPRIKKKDSGPDTLLTPDKLHEIKTFVIEKGGSYRDIAKAVGIKEPTFYLWTKNNYQGLSDSIEVWRLERKLYLAERNIEEFLQMDDTGLKGVGENAVSFKDPQLTKIKADMSKFVAETVGNQKYARVNRLADADGGKISLAKLFDEAENADLSDYQDEDDEMVVEEAEWLPEG